MKNIWIILDESNIILGILADDENTIVNFRLTLNKSFGKCRYTSQTDVLATALTPSGQIITMGKYPVHRKSLFLEPGRKHETT